MIMKRFSQWVIVTTLICGSNMFLSSCSNDDDDKEPVKKYRLVECKEVIEDTGTYNISHYTYDSEGRLATFVREAYNTDFGDHLDANYTYTYGDHFVKEQHGQDGYDLYTLNDDGLIVKHEVVRRINDVDSVGQRLYYGYENERIASYEEDGFLNKYRFDWKDGDLMSYCTDEYQGSADITEYTLSDLTVDHGYRMPPLITMREPLYMMGYYGKPSKHLETHKENSTEATAVSILYEYDFSYTIDKGHITKLVDNHKVTTDIAGYKIEKLTNRYFTFSYEEY